MRSGASGGPGAMMAHRRVLLASLTGTAVEFYDFYIYATAASLVFGGLFFPSTSPAAQQLASYSSFALAFLARPLGAAFFGHFGDRIGRKSTLVASLMMMGSCTVLIGLLPGYASIGYWAPLLLCILRFGQGFGLGGEWGGAALLAVENAPPGWTARFGMFPQLGAPVGFIAANGLFLVLAATMTDAQFMAWGWRLPFVLSSVLVGLGLWVRLKLSETPEFAAALEASPPPKVPLIDVLTRHFVAVLAGTLAVVACFAIFYIATAFALGYGTQTLGISRSAFLGLQLGAILFMALGIVLAGWFSDLASPARVLAWGCAATVVMGIAFGPGLGSGWQPAIFVALAAALLCMGFVYGPLGAYLTQLFPVSLRYSGASAAFNLGGILGGALAPIVAQILVDRAGIGWVGLYLSAAGLISLIGLALARAQAAR